MSTKPPALHHRYKDLVRVHRSCDKMNSLNDGFAYYVERILNSTGEADIFPINSRKLKTNYYHWRIRRVPKEST